MKFNGAEIASWVTAAGTLALALATYGLARKTGDVVRDNEALIKQGEQALREMRRQSESAEASAGAARAQADFASRILLQGSQPLFHLQSEHYIPIDVRQGALETELVLRNVGTGSALLGPPLSRPSLSVEWTPKYHCVGEAMPVLVPAGECARIAFRTFPFNPPFPEAGRANSGALTSFWYMDTAKLYRYQIDMKFEVMLNERPDGPFATMRLIDVQYGAPTSVGSGDGELGLFGTANAEIKR